MKNPKDTPMKPIYASVAAMAAVLSLAACNKPNTGAANSDPGTSDATVNAAQDATSTAVGALAANTGPLTNEGFVKNAAMSDMFEINAAKIAEKKSTNGGVRKFAAEMIKAHTATTAGLKAALAKSGVVVTLPTALDERHQGMVDNLNAAKPEDFDKEYMNQQVAAHKEALDLMKGYADHGDNAALKAAATGTAPKVQSHLDMAQKLQDATKS